MSDDKNVDRGELNILEYGKILSVYRRCSCGGDVEIKKDETGLNIANVKIVAPILNGEMATQSNRMVNTAVC